MTGQLLFRGLSAKVGIFHGPIVKLCPHSTTGLSLTTAPRIMTATEPGSLLYALLSHAFVTITCITWLDDALQAVSRIFYPVACLVDRCDECSDLLQLE